MKVGVLTSLYPGPTRPFEGVFAERRWVGMAARGHQILVVHPQPRTPGPLARGRWAEIRDLPRREIRAELPIRRPRYWHLPGRALANAGRFARAGVATLLQDPPEIVVCDYAWPAAAAVEVLEARGIPTIVSGRGSDVLEVAGEAGLAEPLRRALSHASGWCAVSRDLVEHLDALAGREEGRLVPNGVDTELFRPRSQSDARRQLNLELGSPHVLVAGHLIARKDPSLALDAFARGAPPQAHLTFVGRGPLEEAVRARVSELELGARVRLVGEQQSEALANWYAAADVLLLTSRREGRPNVVLEALASGRPVVATPAGGTAELLEGLAGMLCEGRDCATVAERLAAVLAAEHDSATLARHAAAFSWDASLATLEQCLLDAQRTKAEGANEVRG